MDHAYRFGIEEEYFLADAGSRGTPDQAVLDAFHAAVADRLPGIERELLRAQAEASTPPVTDCAEARAVLQGLRSGLADLAGEHGLRVFAAGTHPLAHWTRQSHTEKPRYQDLAQALGLPGRRNLVGGLHVHVEVPRPEARVDLMNRLMPFLPLLLALSASSPFWQCHRTGLAAYRLCVFGEMPRTGLPELFDGPEDYDRLVRTLTRTGAIPDASYLWWVVRPSVKYPTLELRVADSCTRLEDSLAIAALWRCLVRCADRRPELNRGMTGASRAIVGENLWRAQRDGVRALLLEEGETGEALPLAARLEAALVLVAEDAAALGCAAEVAAARGILARGTSADRQVTIFEAGQGRGLDEPAALAPVVDWLAAATAGREAG
ncbi:carboxylate-amine ligase [Paracraurococcus lichenis]|uniref:Putative glutamate--cysteine ligase 2 n=1 Tax=Paracraurococcus lichenis TaxID=3064888 RepID=A0ABT9E2S6_9PROT|nr:carboxylate-amine ligase [Paracraurococcus sp. LOR1-02]MDO9710468.1 carboxylate-amine ligase [Paracraurococcus sp. LOR1-02]